MDMKRLKILTPDEVRGILEKAHLLWLYEGEPRPEAPHALLTTKRHSDGFAMVGKLLKEQPDVRMRFAEALLAMLPVAWIKKIKRVVGADSSSTLLAADVAKICGAKHIKMIKVEDEKGKRQVWDPDNEPLEEGELVLHIEELITTSASALQVREGIEIANPNVNVTFVRFLPTIVERSDPDNRVIWVEESMIIALLQLSIYNYADADHCLYCLAGSEAILPKEGNNWQQLQGKI
jgi:hypothetical protein